ncbi:uncharacterized protein BP01DRAFT_379715 [Aspergillus saccharolyticus JOP 1030-1]|uniref:F-box domain-containing protein n=1 Tax=Aspergillus saccharolyticus JOP 1030-1 TaxID=1450539 RepID=A0A318ZWQ5_9EURO|nr:hypothetical protein BP01DRAFT_379715 [Aspergillus saccharolyticus JOP 1030-1]PYH48530.1 hypothetical protein BP01DRAFT_379715 [Aspergillus saccharolyticus JOP 1030-1]
MAHLLCLPTEVLLQIVSLLSSNADLAALAIQCRRLYSITDMKTRKRYHRIRVTNSTKHLGHAFVLLVEILKQPLLGRYVRHIEYFEPLARCYSQYKPKNFLNELDMPVVRAAIEQAGFRSADVKRLVKVFTQIFRVVERVEKEGHQPGRLFEVDEPFLAQTLTALLISVSPDVVSMALTQPYPTADAMHWYDDALETEPATLPLYWFLYQINNNDDFPAPGRPKLLTKLRNVYMINEREEVYWYEDRFYYPMDLFGFMTLFHRLPSIESICTDALEADVDGRRGFPFASSHISRIHIHHSLIGDLDLARLICSCKQLREFRYSIGGRATGRDPIATLNDYRTICQALLIHRATLEILDLNAAEQDSQWSAVVEDDVDENLEERRDQEPFFWGDEDLSDSEDNVAVPAWIWEQSGSLKDFSALKLLAVDINFLLYMARGVNSARDKGCELAGRLPPSLESLLIRGYESGRNKNHDNQVASLRALKSDQVSTTLRDIQGVDQTITPAMHVEDPDRDRHLLWFREEEEWSEEDEDIEVSE